MNPVNKIYRMDGIFRIKPDSILFILPILLISC